ncbi:uncharacterized protein LOC129581407 [Paramacrobiotus metropolitanus]|uniref:uncharacterized protein LOC129581407 n=1 Tax=Paramacrobiotus metropolitanus TaxID=2943436 RepID=UPI002445AD5C|nr:uncharacterized protein LOC129581407 [Paramacrobiotus metropolitanus]
MTTRILAIASERRRPPSPKSEITVLSNVSTNTSARAQQIEREIREKNRHPPELEVASNADLTWEFPRLSKKTLGKMRQPTALFRGRAFTFVRHGTGCEEVLYRCKDTRGPGKCGLPCPATIRIMLSSLRVTILKAHSPLCDSAAKRSADVARATDEQMSSSSVSEDQSSRSASSVADGDAESVMSEGSSSLLNKIASLDQVCGARQLDEAEDAEGGGNVDGKAREEKRATVQTRTRSSGRTTVTSQCCTAETSGNEKPQTTTMDDACEGALTPVQPVLQIQLSPNSKQSTENAGESPRGGMDNSSADPLADCNNTHVSTADALNDHNYDCTSPPATLSESSFDGSTGPEGKQVDNDDTDCEPYEPEGPKRKSGKKQKRHKSLSSEGQSRNSSRTRSRSPKGSGDFLTKRKRKNSHLLEELHRHTSAALSRPCSRNSDDVREPKRTAKADRSPSERTHRPQNAKSSVLKERPKKPSLSPAKPVPAAADDDSDVDETASPVVTSSTDAPDSVKSDDPDRIEYVAICCPSQPIIHRDYAYNFARKISKRDGSLYTCWRQRSVGAAGSCPGTLLISDTTKTIVEQTDHGHPPDFERCLHLYQKAAALELLRDYVFTSESNPVDAYKDFFRRDRDIAKLLPTWDLFRRHYSAELNDRMNRKSVPVEQAASKVKSNIKQRKKKGSSEQSRSSLIPDNPEKTVNTTRNSCRATSSKSTVTDEPSFQQITMLSCVSCDRKVQLCDKITSTHDTSDTPLNRKSQRIANASAKVAALQLVACASQTDPQPDPTDLRHLTSTGLREMIGKIFDRVENNLANAEGNDKVKMMDCLVDVINRAQDVLDAAQASQSDGEGAVSPFYTLDLLEDMMYDYP